MSSGPFLTRRGLLSGSVGLAAALAAGCSTGRSSQGGGASAPSAAPVSPPPPVPSTATPSAAPTATAAPAAVAARATVWCCAGTSWVTTGRPMPTTRAAADLPTRSLPRTAGHARRGRLDHVQPDRYLAHLTTGAALPDKPVILSSDGSQGSQVTEGLPQLSQRNMTATFCMTVVLLDPTAPLLPLQRILIDSSWTSEELLQQVHRPT